MECINDKRHLTKLARKQCILIPIVIKDYILNSSIILEPITLTTNKEDNFDDNS